MKRDYADRSFSGSLSAPLELFVGPVVTFNAIDQICNHFKDVEAMHNTETGINNYLTTTLNAPPVARYAEFNDTFTDMKGKIV